MKGAIAVVDKSFNINSTKFVKNVATGIASGKMLGSMNNVSNTISKVKSLFGGKKKNSGAIEYADKETMIDKKTE